MQGSLTTRECQVIRLICDGRSAESIAEQLGILSISHARANILYKLHLPDLTALRLWNSPASDAQLRSLTFIKDPDAAPLAFAAAA